MTHFSLNIGTALKWPDRLLGQAMKDKYGKFMTPDEVRSWLQKQRDLGYEVIPFGPPCNKFDKVLGCTGHKHEALR